MKENEYLDIEAFKYDFSTFALSLSEVAEICQEMSQKAVNIKDVHRAVDATLKIGKINNFVIDALIVLRKAEIIQKQNVELLERNNLLKAEITKLKEI